jgi:hypothetical protein
VPQPRKVIFGSVKDRISGEIAPMKTTNICLSALFVLLLLVGIGGTDATASGGENSAITGLWQGIDSDGSVVLLSISHSDQKGKLEVRLTDTFFSRCVKDYELSSSPGLAEGLATFSHGMLYVEYSLSCYDPSINGLVEVETGETTFRFNRRDGFLIEQHPDGTVRIYYRIDRR